MAIIRKQPVSFVSMDLNIALEEVYKICSTSFAKYIDLDFNYYLSTPFVRGDPAQLQQVLLNLCVNANHSMTIMREAGEAQGGKLTVSLQSISIGQELINKFPTAVEGDEYYVIQISDEGVGISEHLITKIFDPFYTTKDKASGTGLGLATSRGIIEKHDGFIDIYSVKDTGTTFSIYIPARIDAPLNKKEITTKKQFVVGRGSILVIDDEEIIRNVLKRMLEKCGYQVIIASSAAEGIQLYTAMKNEIDLVISDLDMPVMSGDKCLAELQKITRDLNVLLMSGYRGDARVENTIKMGGHYISKPISMYELSVIVNKLIG